MAARACSRYEPPTAEQPADTCTWCERPKTEHRPEPRLVHVADPGALADALGVVLRAHGENPEGERGWPSDLVEARRLVLFHAQALRAGT